MLSKPGDSAVSEAKSAEAVRAKIHKTRAALNLKLDELKTRIFGPSVRTTPMARRASAAAKKRRGKKPSATKTRKTAAQRSARKKKPARASKPRRAAPKAKKVIGDVLTGAALGA